MFKILALLITSLVLSYQVVASVPGFTPKNVWVIAGDEYLPPYNYLDQDGNAAGLDVEIVRAVMDEMQQAHVIKLIPWNKVALMTEGNTLDMAFQWESTAETRGKYLLVGPIRVSKTVLMTLDQAPIRNFTSFAALKSLRFGSVKGYSYIPEYDSADFLPKDPNSTNNEILLHKLILKQNDIIIGDLSTFAYLAKKHGIESKVRILGGMVKETSRYVAFPKEKPEYAAWFAQAFHNIQANGEYQKIAIKWSTVVH
jgi:polar amino acid transport system substrate-binding protein